ncbi:DUF4974 domain-containing protein [Phocaeicola abscessus]|uniref:DUF4974 domain-containing protein n=1 Tax=Phocaeicola abscessus TaxID=555313 RepID=UPI0028E670F3|nr:DUF4974 domain-containing protein [Phocaeicola abscessus]
MEEQFDKILDKLVHSTRSPKGRYTKERTWMLLETRRKANLRVRRLSLIRNVAAAAICCFCILGWAAYYNGIVVPRNPKAVKEKTTVPSRERKTMRFDQAPLHEIVDNLNETFHVNIHIADEALKNYRVTATFGDDESLENMLYLLQRAVNFSYSRENDLILIKSTEHHETD